jgi:hypothetical protein
MGGEQSVWDDLLTIRKQIEATRPEDWVDTIFVTGLPVLMPPAGKIYRIQCREKKYIIIGITDFHELKGKLMEVQPPEIWSPSLPYGTSFSTLYGIPIVENDELLLEMLVEVLAGNDAGDMLNPPSNVTGGEAGLR